ncbi:MAG: F-box protein [Alphaproteobacteria bacterium]
MSGHFTFSALLKLVLIALLMPQIAFSTGSVKRFLEPNDSPRKMVTAPASEALFFEELPSDIIKLILVKLPKKDLARLRLVNKKLKNMATPFITNLEIPGNLPSEKQAKKFFKDLSTDKFWKWKKPSEAFANLFRHAPVEALYFTGQTIHAEAIPTIVSVLPIGLKILWLNENAIGGAGAQALAIHLPNDLQWLWLNENAIGDAGFSALLAAIPRTDLTYLSISTPSSSPLREQFKNLRNRQENSVTVDFK